MTLTPRVRRHLAGVLLLLGATAADAEVLRIGVATGGGGDPVTSGGSALGVVRNQQLLEKAFAGSGTDVQWFFFKGAGPAVNEALSNQQIDFAWEGDLPQVVARANGLDTRLIAAVGTRGNSYVAVPKGSPIKTLADLKGKKVAIFRGTNGHLVAINILKTQGLTERDLKVINLDSGSTLAALATNGVDAAFGGMELFKLRDQGIVDIIYSTQGQDVGLTRQTSLLVRHAYAESHPAQTQKVVDVLVDAARWASDPANQQALYQEWAKSGVPDASWQAEFANQSLRVRNSPLLDPFFRSRYQAVAEQAKAQRLIRQPVSVSGWFDTRYLDKALKDKNLQDYWAPAGVNGQPETASPPSQEVAHAPG
ncbi:PhnD/SsuA/transferrin family substrate-binding protein [Shimwellia pseudoproteus]|uniref:ABC transporter substrate-binding protein n=1 Tax=Shimwellia pseudoproteus TaxID=570012 RepID=UPI0018EB4F8B|nr:ABC transporter substrate-binding protein [Shimwellia pseudoproteus]MBJ3816084.1 PhnD/SsuA/transferrin family substrate-binding protein [Shimwellia pseudoproteus]